MQENKAYKLADYLARSNDVYALTKYQIVMNWLPKTPSLSVLNAGCGSGEMNILLARNPTWTVDAIDVDQSAIDISNQLKADCGLTNLRVFRSSIEELPDESGVYDIIVSNDVLEHIEDDVAAIQKLATLLKPNGIICISVPALQWLFGYHDEQLGHYRRYNRKGLLRKFSPFFQVQHCRYFAALLVPITLIFSCWQRKPYPVGGSKTTVTRILEALLAIEARISFFPLGTSLLLLATPKPLR